MGTLALLGRAGARGAVALPAGFGRELGAAIEQVWRLQQRTRRLAVHDAITRLLVSGDSVDDVLRVFADGLGGQVAFDSLAVALLDPERPEFEVIDVLARSVPHVAPRDARMALDRTLVAQVVASAAPVRIDDLAAPAVPEVSRRVLGERGFRSALLVPLVSRGGVFGAVTLAARRRAAFDDGDVEIAVELARPLASAIEHRRLLEESRRRTEELAALYSTSQLITARLDVPSVLERISRSVTALIGSTGCGIGLLDPVRNRLIHAAAHGFKSDEWRALALPVGEGIIGRCAESGVAIRVDDVRADPRSARRDVDEREGIRSMLCVPLRVAGALLGVISAFSARVAAFSSDHQRVLEAFAEQAGIAVQNARLFEESLKRTRETRALFEAGRTVTASLDPARTVRVIMEQARAVLGVASCGIMTLDPVTDELTLVASLDLPDDVLAGVRVAAGEGIAGRAVRDLRPRQSADLFNDPRVRYRELPRQSGLRAAMAAPLRVGDRAIGVIEVFHREVHQFTAAEEELLVALADQAAIALEHARLYEGLETMVAERTRELDRQKRFVEVVLETLPLGVFVLDPALHIVRANREGARTLGCDPAIRAHFSTVVPPEQAAEVEAFLRERVRRRRGRPPGGGDGHRRRAQALPAHDGAAAGRRRRRPPHRAGRGHHAGQAARAADAADRAPHHGRPAGRRRRPRAEQPAGHDRRLCGGAAGTAQGGRARPAAPSWPTSRPTSGSSRRRPIAARTSRAACCSSCGTPAAAARPTDLNALVLKTIELISHQARYAGGVLTTELDDALAELTVNEGQLRQVFLGLASNALDAMEGQGRLTIRTRRARREVEIEFEDEGPGIPEEIAPRIWDPFFTTKPPGQGTGLGLAIAQGIVTDHGGRIEMQTHVGKGSIFRVVLPA